jgi:hypothetical protein
MIAARINVGGVFVAVHKDPASGARSFPAQPSGSRQRSINALVRGEASRKWSMTDLATPYGVGLWVNLNLRQIMK